MPKLRLPADRELGLILVSTWIVLTGRRLEASAEELSWSQLVEFWADPEM